MMGSLFRIVSLTHEPGEGGHMSLITKGIVIGLVVVGASARTGEAAYLDPGTGGFLFQLLGVLFALFTGIVLLFARQIRMAAARIRR